MAHALLSPSGAHRWVPCPGSVVLEQKLPNKSSSFADEGTAAHFLASTALSAGDDAKDYVNKTICVHDDGEIWVQDAAQPLPRGYRLFRVDAEMVDNVQVYIDAARVGKAELWVEQKLPIASITGELDATGTADAVLIDGNTLSIIDLKYGMGVKVDAEHNQQLAIYALAAVEQFDILGEIDTVTLAISQPRKQHHSEWTVSLDELRDFIKPIRVASGFVRGSLDYADKNNGEVRALDLHPGDKQCRFCNAKGICPALTESVLATVADDFVNLEQDIQPQLEHAKAMTIDNPTLGNLMGALDLIEGWCKAIRAQTESELFAGRNVPGYKLVEGRRGARAWGDAGDVEALMKRMRIKQEAMYDFKLISPTSAEKAFKAGEIGPRQWPQLQALITQPGGKPSVAPATDKRPALTLTAAADDFDEVPDEVIIARLMATDYAEDLV